MVNNTVATALRWLAAVVVFAFFLFWSVFLASLIGWSFEPKGLHRVTGNWPVLIAAVVAGLLGVLGALLVLRRRVLSWWLLLALPVPALIAADQAGWLF